MVKKVKTKNIQGTVYYEPEVLEYLEKCMETSGRKISSEVNYSIRALRKVREKNNMLAADMAEEHFLKVAQDNQPQS